VFGHGDKVICRFVREDSRVLVWTGWGRQQLRHNELLDPSNDTLFEMMDHLCLMRITMCMIRKIELEQQYCLNISTKLNLKYIRSENPTCINLHEYFMSTN